MFQGIRDAARYADPREIARVVLRADVRRAVDDIPMTADVLTTDSLTGARLRAEQLRARIRVAQLVRELERDLEASGGSPEVLDFTREVLDASVTARIVGQSSPLGSLERWCETLVRKSKTAFPGVAIQGVGVAVERNGTFELAVQAHVPRRLQDLLPAPAHRDFPACVREHVPRAESFPFEVGGTQHWFVVVSRGEVDQAVAARVFRLVAAEVARAMRAAA